jgi:peptidoglycan/LPS O-acetylase OafA/YrhL
MTVPSNTASGRSNVLDGVRAVACLLVVFCHISLYHGDESWDGLKNGVMLFFALSGYLLYRPFVMGDVDLRRYAAHRFMRIVPAYLVALVGVSLLTGDRTFADRPLTYLLFLQNYDLALWQGFLGVSWTLVIEVLFYLTLPVLAIVISRSATRLVTIAAVSFLGACLIFFFVPRVHPMFASSTYPTMFWAFAPGMLVALLEGRIPWAARPVTLALGIALMVLGLHVWWASLDLPSGLGAFFIIAWAVERRPSLGPLAIPASIGAALTYSVYLWHVDLLKTIPSTPLALMAIVAVASATYVFVERPFIRVGRRLGRRAPKSPAGAVTLTGPVASSVRGGENG